MKTRTKWVIALAVVVGGIWLMGVFYVLTYKPDVYVSPGVVVSSSSPVASPAVPMQYSKTVSHTSPIHHSSYSQSTSHTTPAPVATMQPSHGLYLTSNASVQSVGGGNNGNGLYSTSHGSSSRGIIYGSASVPATNFIALAANRPMAQPEESNAPQMAQLAPRNAPGPPNPTDLPDDHQLVEHPLGDGLWVLMIAIVMYGVWRFRKEKRLVG